jgi:hypothetical protein
MGKSTWLRAGNHNDGFYRPAWQVLAYTTTGHRPEVRFFDVGFRGVRDTE